jgi:hypothetical protein
VHIKKAVFHQAHRLFLLSKTVGAGVPARLVQPQRPAAHTPHPRPPPLLQSIGFYELRHSQFAFHQTQQLLGVDGFEQKVHHAQVHGVDRVTYVGVPRYDNDRQLRAV